MSQSFPIRDSIAALETQQIMQVSELALDDPDVIPLWYGESDMPTPRFIAMQRRRLWRPARLSILTSAAFLNCAMQ